MNFECRLAWPPERERSRNETVERESKYYIICCNPEKKKESKALRPDFFKALFIHNEQVYSM